MTENAAMLNFIPKKADFIGYHESTFSSIRTWASCSNDKAPVNCPIGPNAMSSCIMD